MYGNPWKRCEHCGIATYDPEHNCVDDALVNKMSAEFEQIPGPRLPVVDGDWRRFRWKPFEDWLRTPQGIYAAMEAENER